MLSRSATVSVLLDFKADFADLNEAQAGKRQQIGLVEELEFRRDSLGKEAHGELALRYKHPDLQLGARIRIAGGDALTDMGEAVACTVSLRPQAPASSPLISCRCSTANSPEPFFGRDGTFDHKARRPRCGSAGLRAARS